MGFSVSEFGHVECDAPSSPQECRDRIAVLQDVIEVIEMQLADPNRLDDSGERLRADRYLKWRRGAVKAMKSKAIELRYLKRWLRAHQHELAARGIDVGDVTTESLLVAAHNVLQDHKQRGTRFSAKEQHVLDLVRDHVSGMAGAAVETPLVDVDRA